MAKLHKWPFRPVHITNDGEDYPDKSTLTGEGVLPNKLMNVHQTAMCVELGQATTLIEFAPCAGRTPLENRICVRTDSPLLESRISPVCGQFREWTKNKCCHQCDAVHARLLSGLTRGDVCTKGPERAAEAPSVQRFSEKGEHRVTFDEIKGRPYISYNCPFLGYRELIFPIFFGQEEPAKDQVLAAYFVGQLCVESELDTVRRRQEALSGALPGLTVTPDLPPNAPEVIRNLHDLWTGKAKVLDAAAYQGLLEQICAELDDFEKVLRGQITLQQDEYVRRVVNDALEQFDAGLAEEMKSKRIAGLDALWKHAGESMTGLVTAFNIQYAIAFGRTGISTDSTELLPVATATGDLPASVQPGSNGVHYDLSKIPDELRNRHSSTPENMELADGLEGVAFDDATMRLRYIPVHHPQDASAMVILLKYGPTNSPHLKVNELRGYLNSTLRTFYSVLVSSVEAFVESATRTNMENVIRVFGHEAAQLTAGLDWLRETYLRHSHVIRDLSPRKLADIQGDMDGYVRQLMLLTSNPRAILTRPVVRPSFFQPFKEMLFKWKDVYRQQALVKSLQFVLPPVSGDDPTRPDMLADKSLLEQLLYNLVGNAVKYSYPGTKIYVDCEKPSTKADSPYILTIRNYGLKIEDDRRIYDLYYRGVSKEEGVGIGMFVAKQIAEAHQGTISHTRREVSKYNVPLLAPYMKLESRYQTPELASKIKNELLRLRQNGDDARIVSVDEELNPVYNPVRLKILGEIRNPTYEVIFTVTIPQGDRP